MAYTRRQNFEKLKFQLANDAPCESGWYCRGNDKTVVSYIVCAVILSEDGTKRWIIDVCCAKLPQAAPADIRA